MQRTAPVSTAEPFVTATVTVPSQGAIISFSIFIASRIKRTSPFLTLAPFATLMSRTLPGIGAVTDSPPAGAAATGAGAAAGAAAGVGAAFTSAASIASSVIS